MLSRILEQRKMIDIFLATRMACRDNAGGDCVLLMKHWTVRVTAQASST